MLPRLATTSLGIWIVAGQSAGAQPVVTQVPTSVTVDSRGESIIHFRSVPPMTIDEAIAQLPETVPLGEVRPDGSIRPGIEIRNDTAGIMHNVARSQPIEVVLQPDGGWKIREGSVQIDDAAFEPRHSEIVYGSETIALSRAFTPDAEFTFPIHTTMRLKRADGVPTYDNYALHPEFCDPDVNWDHIVDQRDVECLVGMIYEGEDLSCANPDFNRDGVADLDDIGALVSAIAGGDCP